MYVGGVPGAGITLSVWSQLVYQLWHVPIEYLVWVFCHKYTQLSCIVFSLRVVPHVIVARNKTYPHILSFTYRSKLSPDITHSFTQRNSM